MHQALKMGIPIFFSNFYIDNIEHSGDTIVSRWENVTISQCILWDFKYWTPFQNMVT